MLHSLLIYLNTHGKKPSCRPGKVGSGQARLRNLVDEQRLTSLVGR